MKLSTSLVAVKKITSNTSRSSFAHDELEHAAKLILKAEGVVNPIVLCRTSLESYEVVDGDFEYYAAVRAREIEPRKGEMIGAFIIEPENEDFLKEQIKIFRKRNFEDKNSLEVENVAEKNLYSSLKNFEQMNEVFSKVKEIDSKQTKNQQDLEILTGKVESIFEAVSRVEKLLNKQHESIKNQSIIPPKLPKDYRKMTVIQLKAEAKEKNIKGYSRMKKKDLIAELKKTDAR